MQIIGRKLDDKIASYIDSGLYQNRVIPILNYKGDYSIVYSESSENPYKSSRFFGMVEETFIDAKDNCYFVIREAKMPHTGVSLLYVKDNNVKIWFPFIRDLMESLECLYQNDKRCIAAISVISEKLSNTPEFNVENIAKEYEQDKTFVKRVRFNDEIPVPVLYSLIKNIMISEDKKYNEDFQLGRYLMQLAFYDYVCLKEDLNKVLKKYHLYPNQKLD